MNILKIPLKQAFNSTFHNKHQFADFLNSGSDYTKLNLSNYSILSPSQKLKKYLRFLNSFIFDYALVNKNVYSYIKGKSTYGAIQKHAHSKYFFKTDIENFFASIDEDGVQKILKENLNKSPIIDIEEFSDILLNLITVDNKIPVGFSTSANISNTYLYNFDESLEKYCIESNIIYTRYSDDIILSSNTNNLQNIQTIISEYLDKFFNGKLKLNSHKTKHLYKGAKIKLLGMVILPSGEISVDIQVKRQLEVLLHFYINDKSKFDDYLRKKYDGNLSSVSGKLYYINMIDSSYLSKLRQKYGNFIVDSFFNRTIK